MRWQGQQVGATDPDALPGLESLGGLVRSVTTPEFAGMTFHEVLAKSALNHVPGPSAMHVEFAPTRFVPIDGFTDSKLAMLRKFASRGDRPDYLAPDFVLASARYWSHYGPGAYCEPLEVIRESVLAPVGAPATAPVHTHAHDTASAVA